MIFVIKSKPNVPNNWYFIEIFQFSYYLLFLFWDNVMCDGFVLITDSSVKSDIQALF